MAPPALQSPLIALLPGDGIGPEVLLQAQHVLEEVSNRFALNLRFEYGLLGGVAIEATGSPLPPSTLDLAHRSTAILAGAVGGPAWDDLPPDINPGLGGMLRLRREFDLFTNLRPVTGRQHTSAGIRQVDLLLVREASGGLYFSEPRGRELVQGKQSAFDTMRYAEPEIRRIVRKAAQLAQGRSGRLVSVDKANVLESSRLWREVATDEMSHFPDLEVEHLYVDNAAYQLALDSSQFDVLVTENLFGDILSDLLAGLVGSLGYLPSAGINDRAWGLYEPVHGSAPDIAGRGIANPIAAIRSAALLLRHSLERPDAATAIENACNAALTELLSPTQISGSLRAENPTTAEMGELVMAKLAYSE